MIARALAATWLALNGAHGVAGEVAPTQLDYMLNCQGCHLADGSGYPGKVPNLRTSLGPLLAVEGGREYLLRVPGAATAPLDDTRLAAVMNWMIDEFTPTTSRERFAAFAPAEIGRLRAAPLTEVQAARRVVAERAGIPAEY